MSVILVMSDKHDQGQAEWCLSRHFYTVYVNKRHLYIKTGWGMSGRVVVLGSRRCWFQSHHKTLYRLPNWFNPGNVLTCLKNC